MDNCAVVKIDVDRLVFHSLEPKTKEYGLIDDDVTCRNAPS
jgi:hypothetical protein